MILKSLHSSVEVRQVVAPLPNVIYQLLGNLIRVVRWPLLFSLLLLPLASMLVQFLRRVDHPRTSADSPACRRRLAGRSRCRVPATPAASARSSDVLVVAAMDRVQCPTDAPADARDVVAGLVVGVLQNSTRRTASPVQDVCSMRTSVRWPSPVRG